MLNRFPTAVAALLLAEAVIYLPGVAWLAVLFGPANSIVFGLTPFLTGEALKIGLALGARPCYSAGDAITIEGLFNTRRPHPRPTETHFGLLPTDIEHCGSRTSGLSLYRLRPDGRCPCLRNAIAPYLLK